MKKKLKKEIQKGHQFSLGWNLFNFGERPCNWNGIGQPRQTPIN